MYIIGIDPGKYGAIAYYNCANQSIDVKDCPLTKIETIDYSKMAELVKPHESNAVAIMEQVNSYGMGKQSAFNFGVNVGAWRSTLACYSIPVQTISPRIWKPGMGLSDDKSRSIELAKELFPNMASKLTRKKDHDRAEAMLLIHYFLKNQSKAA
jgi:crossover junction endodeoxyribonuclease RuvC